ncbi:MAG TPA: hypothetical protein VFC78_19025 [Tepidisphaeraceae bacterium]|nr:hypothetical protein [Tepidisphaeraceae bacterium]
MTASIETIDPPAARETPASPPGGSGQVRTFVLVSAQFMAGLLVAILIFDQMIGVWLRRTNQERKLGGEVFMAVQRAHRKNTDISAIFLGDSVSHQLFRPGREPPGVCFLTSNQAVTAAGQFYLMDDALRHYRGLKDVYLFYLPACWTNDMPRAFTRDYFCAYFHTFDDVVEVFKVKRDFELLFAHADRWLMPHIMLANSLQRPVASLGPAAQTALGPRAAGTAPLPPDPEPLLTPLSRWLASPPAVVPRVPAGSVPVILSPVSRHYLARMRQECAAYGVRLHILPCPVSTFVRFADPDHVYDAPIINDIDPATLLDAVHFKQEFIEPARERVIKIYGLKCLEHMKDDAEWGSATRPATKSHRRHKS